MAVGVGGDGYVGDEVEEGGLVGGGEIPVVVDRWGG